MARVIKGAGAFGQRTEFFTPALLGVLPSVSLLRANSNPQLQQAQIVYAPPPPRLPATPPLLVSCGPRIGEADTLPVAQRLWGRPSRLLPRDVCFLHHSPGGPLSPGAE